VILLIESDRFEFVDEVFLAENELDICTSFDGLERYPSLEFEKKLFCKEVCVSKKRSFFCGTAQGCFPWAI
jgi:hypothetical protein